MHRRFSICLFIFVFFWFSNFTTFAQKAFIIDDRLAALRRAPDMQSEVVRRLRIGRPVYITATQAAKGEQPQFYRVSVTRRTRGWLHVGAVVIPGRAGEDRRLMKLIDSSESFDRLLRGRFFLENFPRSPLRSRVLLAIAQEAERAAGALNRAADRRLKNLRAEDTTYRLRDYYLSDTGLDRYSRLQIHFAFIEPQSEYVYDGQAYREILKHFPKSEEAEVARKQLALAKQRLAKK